MRWICLLFCTVLFACEQGDIVNSNRYNSITETFQAEILLPVPLSTYVTPPGAFTIPNGDFVVGDFRFDNSVPSYFKINDIPRITMTGMFCSIGDGLAPQPDKMGWIIRINAVDNTGSIVGTLASFPIVETSLNEFTEYDFFAQTIFGIKQNLSGYITSGATSIQISASVVGDKDFAAYSMAPAWAAASISFIPKIVVEHTFETSATP